MKYKINFERTRDVLHEHGLAYFRDDKYIYVRTEGDCTKRVMKLEENDGGFDDFVEAVKNGELNECCEERAQLIIKILHPHFNECFEEIKQKVSLDKCVNFLIELGMVVTEDEDGIYVNTLRIDDKGKGAEPVDNNLNNIVIVLNGGQIYLTESEDVWYTILKNNRDTLLED